MSRIVLPSTSRNVDIKAQPDNYNETLRSPSRSTAGSRTSASRSNRVGREDRSRVTTSVDDNGDEDVTKTPDVSFPHRGTPSPTNAHTRSGWKPWKADEPLRTKIPKSGTTMEDWVEAMEASDDGMCKGWRDQIDTLIIFAGLFSATVTAFTVESYQWLEETPASTLARLQLRNLLDASRDPEIDRLAPATFIVSSASVAINTLWFSSLTLSLAAVVISILCKQWLHEYQRYDNFTTNEAFLIHGLRHRGLRAWRVPEIIAFLPILLQTALVLFLVGILVLLWPLQAVVVSITTIIVGLTFLFLSITTVLPSIQYIYPQFNTQCAYKSSQSWSLLFISTFWLFDFEEFTSWALFDRWEVTRVYNDAGRTLFRVYKLLCNSVDAVLSIYSFLADASLTPTVNEDLALLSDFVDGLNVSDLANHIYEGPKAFQRIKQLKGCIEPSQSHPTRRRLKPGMSPFRLLPSDGASLIDSINYGYHSRIQSTLNIFLQSQNHLTQPALFNRYVEHWARGTDTVQSVDGTVQIPYEIYSADIQYDPEIATYLVEIHGHLFKTNRFRGNDLILLIRKAYPKLMDSYHQHKYHPPPITLLKDIQEWVNRVPRSEIYRKVHYAEHILFSLAFDNEFRNISESHTSKTEKRYLISFARFFLALFEREDILQQTHMDQFTKKTLMFFRGYLDQNTDIAP